MSKLIFAENAWEEYVYWQTQDKKTLKRINSLLKDISRNAFEGIGKPEALKNRDGCWSRRIDEVNRVVYSVSDAAVEILQCKGHYDD
jgi:toxin YoeB